MNSSVGLCGLFPVTLGLSFSDLFNHCIRQSTLCLNTHCLRNEFCLVVHC